MPVNVVLVRWEGGWREVRNQASIDTFGRREALLSLGTVSSPDEVDRIAGQQLAVFGNPRMAIAADHAPHGRGDRPFFDYNVGDTITVPAYGGGTISQRVRAISGAEDDNGEVTYSPELGDLILEEQERTLQALKKMADGTLEGDSPVATPRTTWVNENEWGGGPLPGGATSPGFTADTTAPMFNPYSLPLYSVPTGAGTYTLTRMWARPTTDGINDELRLHMELWQLHGGDGDTEVAHVNLSFDFQADVVYDGTIFQSEINFDPNTSPPWGIQFRYNDGTMTGEVYVVAEFEGGGQTVTVAWYPPTTLRVAPGRIT